MRTVEKSQERSPGRERGVALIPAILVVSGMAIFLVALLTAVMSGRRTVVSQNEDYHVSSAVESVAMLTAEDLWSDYIAGEGGQASDIDSFREFLSARGIENVGAGGPPAATDGTSLLAALSLPVEDGRTRFNDVNVDAVQVVRRDTDADSTQLFLTVSASTTRGDGIVNPVFNRAVQQVYTVEPEDFPGFEYALLANNVNCIFCHTQVDSALRWWNADPDHYGSFERVKVGTLETLQIRKDADGNTTAVNDGDADSMIAGSLYIRGTASDGSPITNWNSQWLKCFPFDSEGDIVQDETGDMNPTSLSPAGDPPEPFENLYLNYPTAWADMVDGLMPQHFPPPFPDDGGIGEDGLPVTAAANNRIVDDSEFDAVAVNATGAITAGIVNVTDADVVIDTPLDYADAIFQGNTPSVQGAIEGNVVLTGYANNPIWIDGALAVDGDLIIQGYVKGEGVLYVRGNVYVPTDLMYLDGTDANGRRTYGIAQDGTKNALGLTAGGNILIGDFQRPAALQPDLTVVQPGQFQIISGNPDTGDPMVDDWSFVMAEVALFNRGEWAKTQEFLPGPTGPVANPDYALYNPPGEPAYVPRYYAFGEDTVIPIFNQNVHYDTATHSWVGPENTISWDPTYLTLADPNNPADPVLFNADGTPKAVTSPLSHAAGWMDPHVYKLSVEYFEGVHPNGSPMMIDGLLYTNNAIFSIVYRNSDFLGRMTVNGALVAADVGMLVPGKRDNPGALGNNSVLSNYAVGLQLNYDERVKRMLNVKNPFQVQLKRTFWNPTANLL